MKQSKRVQKAQEMLLELEEFVSYYTCKTKHKEFNEYFEFINNLLVELSIDQRVDHARFAKKLKAMFKKSIAKK